VALVTSVGGANGQVQITLAGVGGQFRQVGALHWSLSADPSAGVPLTITSTGVDSYTVYITRGGPGTLDFAERFSGLLGNSVVVTLGAAGGTVVGTLNVFTDTSF